MDDLFKIDISFPVPGFSYLPIAPDSYRDGTRREERLLKTVSVGLLWSERGG